ncbi:unnamed protein product [Rotaria sordida]|uniref:Uncharacterized protein n=1 Tax=Rotaria sordida TaxID=392033 RepID=A0A814NSG4_9BILA|nr:unnamed protein product [Rotaria sordida]CAF1095325.1 unnamed protein product [Rotaria sordida]
MKPNVDYLIMEAQNRIGDRAFTDKTIFSENILVDIGTRCSCHHRPGNIFRSYYILLNKDFIESDSYNESNVKICNENGNIISDGLINTAMKIIEELLSIVEAYRKEASDRSILDIVNDQLNNISDEQIRCLLKMCLSYTKIHESSRLNELSSKHCEKREDGLQECDLSIANGLNSLVRDIASKYNLPIELHFMVTNLDILPESDELRDAQFQV